MFAVPPAILEMLGLKAGSVVALEVEGGKMIVSTQRKQFLLTDLLAQCDASAPSTNEDQTWLSSPPVGLELI
jgi:antitoxin ChpS